MANREWDLAKQTRIRRERDAKTHCVVFFCSSAGEYEQARPLASRLLELPQTYVHFLFFSQSGYSFAVQRKETIPFSLSPLDSLGNWRKIFAILRPQVFVVVRHELWPCCLWLARQRSKVLLVNASLQTRGRVSIFLKSLLLSLVDKIYTVSEQERLSFQHQFANVQTNILAVGDSKYDRVLERAAALQGFARFPMLEQSRPRLVVGSAWKKDCELALSAFTLFKAKHAGPAQLVLAPHQPNSEFISWLEQECAKTSLPWARLSQLASSVTAPEMIIVDSVGLLFDLYGVCDLAFVGGALHHKVHNVLEPAAFSLPLAFGPFFENSHEACEIFEKGLATVVHNAKELLSWMEPLLLQPQKNQALQQFLASKAGATDRILLEIATEFRAVPESKQVAMQHS